MAVSSSMLPLGTEVPDFALTDVVTGRVVTPADFDDRKGLLVMFICNHCPYVQHIRPGLVGFAADTAWLGIIAISSNDPEQYPADSPAEMRLEAERYGYGFPYLFDESQQVAKAFTAMCTPDFFLFGPGRRLVYRGRFDSSRPGNQDPVSGADLRAAVDALLSDREIDPQQHPSMGCSIKWRPGNAPPYFTRN